MKKIILTSILFFSIFLIFNISKQARKITPQPFETKVISGENENPEKREEWIEKMHKTAPGVNWRKIDAQTRVRKAKKYISAKSLQNNNVEIAGGELNGTWREVGSKNLAGRTLYIDYDSNEDSIYCASAGGNIWKAGKTGSNWRCLNDNFRIPNIGIVKKIARNNSSRLLVSSEEWGTPGFWYSDNEGQTWNSASGLSNIENWGTVVRTVVSNGLQKQIYLLSFEWDYSAWEEITCLYVSTDKGESFTKIKSYKSSVYGNKNRFDICSVNQNDTLVYLLQNDSIFYIDNNFNTIFINNVPVGNTGNLLLKGVNTNNQTCLYAAEYENNNTVFYRSSDAGNTWEQKGNVSAGPFRRESFSVSSLNQDVLYFGGVECYVSNNAATSWTRVNEWSDYYSDMLYKLHADIPSINSFIDNSGNEFEYINTDGGTYISYDNLQNVNNISISNLNISQYYSVYSHRTDSAYIYAGSQDQGYQMCNNNDNSGTENFTQIVSGDYGHIVSADGGNSVWMVYPGYAVYYPDAVGNPSSGNWWTFTCSGQFWIPPLMEDPDNTTKVFLGGGTTSSGTHLFHLSSSGSNISVDELGYDFSGSSNAQAISAMAYSPLNSNYRYVMNGEGDFFTSTDGGATWTETNNFDGPDGNYLYGAKIVTSQTQLGKIYVAGSGYSNSPVFVSTDNGNTFSALNNGLPNTMVYDMAITPDDNFLFAATEVGPYVYVSSENQWYDLSQGNAPDQIYWSVDYLPLTKTVRFGTYGRGIWDFKIQDNVTSSKQIASNKQLQIYPNPAQSFINIRNTKDLVYVYDLSGKLILKTSNRKIDVSTWNKGIYIVKSGNTISKFVKM